MRKLSGWAFSRKVRKIRVMTTLAYNEAEVLRRLGHLCPERQAAFAASCCERMIGNYVAFSAQVNWGDVEALRNGLNLVWDYAMGKPVAKSDFAKSLRECEASIPDSDDFSIWLCGPGQEAAIAICRALLGCRDRDNVREFVSCSYLSISTVDCHVQEIENMSTLAADRESRIRDHPLMQKEIGIQNCDLAAMELQQSIEQFHRTTTSRETTNINLPSR